MQLHHSTDGFSLTGSVGSSTGDKSVFNLCVRYYAQIKMFKREKLTAFYASIFSTLWTGL
jgi:hypothetical protein